MPSSFVTKSFTRRRASGGVAGAVSYFLRGNVQRGSDPLAGFRVANVAAVFGEQPDHVCDDGEVDQERADLQTRSMVGDLVDLNRHIDGAAQCGQPLRPAALVPEPIGFDETDEGDGDGDGGGGGGGG